MNISQRISELSESATLRVTGKAKALLAEGCDVISFGAGQPDYSTPKHIRDAAKQALDEGHTGYAIPASGLAESKRAVVDRLARVNKLSYKSDQIIITVGGKEALYLGFMSLLNAGDEVIVPTPYWVSYPDQIRLAQGKVVTVVTSEGDGFCLTPEQLHQHLTPRTRAVVLNYPNNPGGSTYDRRRLESLAEVLKGRDIVVISDEMYDQLVYDGQTHTSWASLNPETYAQTLTIQATSKSYAMTGWRLGYAAGPRELIQGMAKMQSQTTSGTTHFAQYGLIAALTKDQDCVKQMRNAFDRRRQLMLEQLSGISGIECVRPTGAFYCFPNVSGTFQRLRVSSGDEFAERLLNECHVAVVPGSAFGCKDNVRLAYALDEQRMLEGLERIRNFVSR